MHSYEPAGRGSIPAQSNFIPFGWSVSGHLEMENRGSKYASLHVGSIGRPRPISDASQINCSNYRNGRLSTLMLPPCPFLTYVAEGGGD